MPKKNAGFVDEHIEKVVVGLCALFLVASMYIAFGGRFNIDGNSPREIADQTGKTAETVANTILTKRPDPPKPPDQKAPAGKQDDILTLKQWFGEQAIGLIGVANLTSPVARTQPFPPPLLSTTETSPENRHNLALIDSPGLPVVTTGRSTFEFPSKKKPLDIYDGGPYSDKLPPSQRNWVAVAAQVDLVQQDIYFKTEKYPDGAYLGIVQVHLERFDQNEPWRGWQNVTTYQPFAMPERPVIIDPVTGGFKAEGLSEFKELIDRKQEVIARPLMTARTGGDRFTYPPIPYFPDPPGKGSDDASSRAKKWLQLALKAKDGRSPFDAEDLDAAFLLLRAAVGTPGQPERELRKAESALSSLKKQINRIRKDFNPNQIIRPPERLMPIVAYDMDVVAGHTYEYRIRYEVFNTFAGNTSELLNPVDAEKLTVFSGWSPASRPVTIESDTYFYLTKADDNKKELTVTVYKKKGRDSVKEATFKVAIGEEIGGEKRKGTSKTDFTTGAICLDIDFNRKVNGKTDVTLVYVDTRDGSVREKYLSTDKSDKFRKALTSEKTAGR
ncbi:MAG: hypothetical protein IPK83_13065 [Planctomycetes bacterium]|nr:hypothetical protein [Planctomycetota bacterium]